MSDHDLLFFLICPNNSWPLGVWVLSVFKLVSCKPVASRELAQRPPGPKENNWSGRTSALYYGLVLLHTFKKMYFYALHCKKKILIRPMLIIIWKSWTRTLDALKMLKNVHVQWYFCVLLSKLWRTHQLCWGVQNVIN